MAQDDTAACEGAPEARANDVINDSRGSMLNIHSDVLYPQSRPDQRDAETSIDDAGDRHLVPGLPFIGYYAKAVTEDTILDHKVSGSAIRVIKVHGLVLLEVGLNAAIAGYYGVPVVLVSGDTAIYRQSQEAVGKDLETVAAKETSGLLAAKLVPVTQAWEMNQVT